ncbi:Pr6Pr family membrane protein [Limnovirga soli]|uniref:Pr6Pr family membrane protein n=1 Tax=Limnovirga soli TaxID=2656915 RepID=A0A8J8FG67_9BACT|nr:Pr6Pr family membrane protein [Limnovirga soli]NNV56363.1 hypothetical protein [Limnovirga soli]
METKKKGTLLLVIIALAGWLALGTQLYIIINRNIINDTSLIEGIIKFFSFFTVLTNLMVALCATTNLLNSTSRTGKFFARTSVKSAITVYIIIVCVVYNLMLRNLWNPQGLQLIADIILHQVIPALYFIYWLFFVTKGKLKWYFSLSWLVLPFFYLVYTLIRGAATGHYPYPFMDISQIGISQMFLNTFIVMCGFIGIALIIIAIDQAMKPNKEKRLPAHL